MRFSVVYILTFANFVLGRSVDFEDSLEQISSYNYLERYGIPLAKRIREVEEAEITGVRIVGGSTASFGQFPYQAGLLITFPGGQGVCGGSLINNRRVLTAAHCWWDGRNQAQRITVILGSIRLYSGGIRMDTRDIIIHELWDFTRVSNDIAVIRLPSEVSSSAFISPITLPSGSLLFESFNGYRAIASGFGQVEDDVPINITQVLSYVTLDVISNAICARHFEPFITLSSMCTSGAGGRGICHGDSGGPLVITYHNRPLLIGVGSFYHRSGCSVAKPAAYSRVTSFIDFITANL